MQVYINVTPLSCAINTQHTKILWCWSKYHVLGFFNPTVLLHGVRVIVQSFLKTNLILLASVIYDIVHGTDGHMVVFGQYGK